MSKGYVALIAVLALLAGAGCTAAVMSYADKKDRDAQFDALMEIMQNAAETSTEKTSETTEATIAETAASTTAAIVETTESVSTEAATSQNDGFYDMIQNELIPVYGLSDLSGFDRFGQIDRTFYEKTVPKSAQGIIGAKIYDFDQDGTKECIVTRAEESSYYLELYNADKVLLDTYTLWEFEPDPNASYTPAKYFIVSIIDHRIVIEYDWIRMPGFSAYGTHAEILAVSEDGFTEQLRYGGSRHPGSCSLYVNEQSESVDEFEETPEFSANVLAQLQVGLLAIEMEHGEILAGWDLVDSYGFEVPFTDEIIPVFDFKHFDDLDHFDDPTGLRDKIS